MSAPKVFGIGLSRTGTTSLTEALRRLGLHSAHFPLVILARRDGQLSLDAEAVREFDALTDTPVAFMYRELDAAFPGSKFILTVRGTDAWLSSAKRLRASYRFLRFIPKVAELTQALYGPAAYEDQVELKRRYEAHTAGVLAYFGDRIGHDLLVYEISEGWGPLCEFLHLPVPGHSPFPHANRNYATTWRNMLDFAGYPTHRHRSYAPHTASPAETRRGTVE